MRLRTAIRDGRLMEILDIDRGEHLTDEARLSRSS